MNLLLANLALADLLLLLFTALYNFYPYIMHISRAGLLASAGWVCTLSGFLPNICWAATIKTFVAILVERWALTQNLLANSRTVGTSSQCTR